MIQVLKGLGLGIWGLLTFLWPALWKLLQGCAGALFLYLGIIALIKDPEDWSALIWLLFAASQEPITSWKDRS